MHVCMGEWDGTEKVKKAHNHFVAWQCMLHVYDVHTSISADVTMRAGRQTRAMHMVL